MRNPVIVLFLCFCWTMAQSQSSVSFTKTLVWENKPFIHQHTNGKVSEIWNFKGGSFSDEYPTLPIVSERFELPGNAALSATIEAAIFEDFDKKPSPDDAFIGASIKVEVSVEQERQRWYGRYKFIPLVQSGSHFQRLKSCTVSVQMAPKPAPIVNRGGPNTFTSVLNDGDIYKLGIAQTGLYKLDFNFLKNQLNIANLENIDPRTIKIYGNGGAMLSERVGDNRPDDLLENAIKIVGEADGVFNSGDYILLYATGPDVLLHKPSATDPELVYAKNIYDTHAYYFIKVSSGNGLRVANQASVAGGVPSTQFDDAIRLEEDKVNLLDFANTAQGSGKAWYGDYFYQTRTKDYSAHFNFPNIDLSKPGRAKAVFVGRSDLTQKVKVTVAGTAFEKTITQVDVSDNEAKYANEATMAGSFTPNSNQISVRLDYPAVAANSEGWLDYIELNVRRNLLMDGQIMEFRDLQSIANPVTSFRLSNVSGAVNIWDVTNAQAIANMAYTGSGTVEFGANTQGSLRRFVAFYDNAAFLAPALALGKLENQNYHSITDVDLAIVYGKGLGDAAQKLAMHRTDDSGMQVATVDVDKLYNEFSSGGKDPGAIRDFAKMLLDRNTRFKYLLLLGDGSFDPRNITNSEENKDLVPVFETLSSLHPITAHPSDDFFGLLSDGEDGSLNGALDIAVGRLTARDASEADAIVTKILAYDKDPQTLGDWHNRLLFIGDDEDSNAHINQADKLSNEAQAFEKFFNIEKVYFDAYQQVATSAGDRFPDAKSAINSSLFKGNLVMQYIGHGGPRGWAQERVVDNNDIAGWENPNRYPLIITATCSFGGYDEYGTLTGGEQSLSKINSGAIALFTTVRAVYISGNNVLTDAVQDYIFADEDGKQRTIGEVLKDAKNTLTGGNEDNGRRFTLLGDPSMHLALPVHRVHTTKINKHSISIAEPDTIRSLQPVELEGEVTDVAGQRLTGFNGKVFVTVFDKPQTIYTLGQDATSPVRPFNVQRNVLFKGTATVNNGAFSLQFIVPKDIDYNYGLGKISYYADNGTHEDAAGADCNIVIGGSFAGASSDDIGPKVKVYMNTEQFVQGGITDANPKILVVATDDFGINVAGSSIGHDLSAVLDDNVQETIILNDFFSTDQDNYKTGRALYPLRNLASGLHKVTAKAWDTSNNSAEGFTEFVVASDGAAALEHVLNYPNPFTTNTYFQFEHNLSGQLLDVQISVFTVAGKLVKTLHHTAQADGFRVTDIAWDGKDDYGDTIGKGVYLYRVKVRGTDVNGIAKSAESDFEKLVILK